jgi:anti-sigma B factor antagonist
VPGYVARMTDDFTLTSAYLGGHAHVVTIGGELDVATTPRLRDELDRIRSDGGAEVVVDLLKVPLVDSTALGILVEASKRASARGGTFRLVCDDRRVARIIEITGLERVLLVHLTLRDALEALTGRPLAGAST